MSRPDPDTETRALLLEAFPPPDPRARQDWEEVARRAGGPNDLELNGHAPAGPSKPYDHRGDSPRTATGSRVWRRHVRQQPVLALVIVAALVAIPVTALAVTVKPSWSLLGRGFLSQIGLGPAKDTAVLLVTQGTWDGQGWAFTVDKSVRGSLCMQFTPLLVSGQPPRAGSGGSCGPAAGTTTISLNRQPPRELNIVWSSGTASVLSNRRLLHYFIGDVVSSASQVAVTLGDGTVVRVPTIAAPKGLGFNVRFFAAQLPAAPAGPIGSGSTCRQDVFDSERVSPFSVVGLAGGRVVAELSMATFIRNHWRRQASQCGQPYRNEFEFPFPPTYPAADRKLTTVERIIGPYGATATVAVGKIVPVPTGQPLANGAVKHELVPSRCWRVAFSDGQSQGSCTPDAKRRNPGFWFSIQHAGRDTFVIAQATPQTGPPVTRIIFQLANGQTLSAKPIDGVVVFAIPRDALSTKKSQAGFLIGYDAQGHALPVLIGYQGTPMASPPVISTRQIVYYRSCPPGSSCYS